MRKFIFYHLLLLMLIVDVVHASETTQIEVFDIDQEKVVKYTEMNEEIYEELKQMIAHITNVYQEFNPVPEHGFMIKLPLDKPITVDNEWLQNEIDEAIIIYPEYEQPHMLLFDINGDFHIFSFQYDTETFLNAIGYWPFDDSFSGRSQSEKVRKLEK